MSLLFLVAFRSPLRPRCHAQIQSRLLLSGVRVLPQIHEGSGQRPISSYRGTLETLEALLSILVLVLRIHASGSYKEMCFEKAYFTQIHGFLLEETYQASSPEIATLPNSRRSCARCQLEGTRAKLGLWWHLASHRQQMRAEASYSGEHSGSKLRDSSLPQSFMQDRTRRTSAARVS